MEPKFIPDCSYRTRNAALLLKDPLEEVRLADSTTETLGFVLQETVLYIAASRNFGVDPLAHLGIYYPDFDMEYREPDSEREALSVMSAADYIIPTDNIFNPWRNGFFTMTRRKKHVGRRRMCFCPADNQNDPVLGNWPYQGLNEIDGQVLIYDPAGKIEPGKRQLLVNCMRALELAVFQQTARRMAAA